MVRLQLFAPFLQLLSVEQSALDRLFETNRVSLDMVARPDVFVPAQTMYALVEGICAASAHRFAGVHVGENVDLSDWSPLTDSLQAAVHIGDFLLRFTAAANLDATSVFYALDVRASRVSFSERRVAEYGIEPRHNDGFGIAYICKILRMVLGADWKGEAVVVHVCDPSVVPPAYLGVRVASTDVMGYSVSFPASWMLSPLNVAVPVVESDKRRRGPPETVADSLAISIEPLIGDAQLNAQRVAALLGVSERTLARRLSREGTTIAREIARSRHAAAERSLLRTGRSIADIAESVGYRDPAVFARAFRRWSGVSPTEYRRQRLRETHAQS